MKKRLLMLFLGIFLTMQALAQQKVVKGIVTDETSTPLPGVSVKIKGSSIATSTTTNGAYAINVNQGQTLVFSYLGTIAQEHVIGNSDNLMVTLKPDEKSLQEIVVVGYGTQKKSELTGAVSTIDVAKTIGTRPVADLSRGLQGASPGLMITTSSGDLGRSPEIHIRGIQGSLNAEATPLILLDNVAIPNMMSVNPEDIESISILKDAASAAIYGARGAWGVILLTSKKGKAGAMRVSYNNNFAWSSPMNTPQIADGADGAEYMLKVLRRTAPNTANFSILGAFYDDLSIERMRQWKSIYGGMELDNEMVEGRDFERRAGQPYFYREWDADEVFLNASTPQMKHNLSISGGNDKTTYYGSFGMLNQKGLVKVAPERDSYTRYNGTMRIESKINNWFTARGLLMHAVTGKTWPNFRLANAAAANEYWFNIYRYPKTYPYGTFNGLPLKNTLNELQQASMNSNTGDNSRVQVGSTVTFLKGWTADLDFTYEVNNTHSNVAATPISGINSWVDPTLTIVVPNYFPAEDYVEVNSAWNRRSVGKAYTTYDRKIKEHRFKLMAGTDIEYYKNDFQYSKAMGLMLPSKPTLNLTTGAQFANGYPSNWSTLGFFGRLNYSYNEKYLLEANIRQDGSSNFPVNQRWGTFPSVSAGYIISNEKFMDWIKEKSSLSFLKLRASWGSLGNNDVGGNSYIRTMGASGSNWWIGGKNPTQVGVYGNISESLTWETVQTLDLGINAKFFKNALDVEFGVYNRTTKDMVSAGLELPLTLGAAPSKRNFGEMQTKGWELAISYNKQFSNGMGFNVTGNLSDQTGKVTKFANSEVDIKVGGNETPNYEGKILGEIWGYHTDRLFTENDFYGNNGLANPTWIYADGVADQDILNTSGAFHYGPGDVKYLDLNGDGVVDFGQGTNLDHGDMRVIGNTTPRYIYGLRLGFNYKGFDVSGFFQGVGKRDYWGTGSLFIPSFTKAEAAYQNQMDYWTPERPNAFYPAPADANANNHNGNWQPQTRYLLNMAYLRVKNITLGYNVPKQLTQKVKVSNLRIFASGENLFTFDKLDMTIDPEIQQNNVGGITDAKSFGRTYPYFRTWSFGLQVDL